MKCEYLSVSRCEQYLECPSKYWFTYEKGLHGDADHLKFGRVIHKTLEEFHRDAQNDILEVYERKWREQDPLSLSYYRDGRTLLKKYVSDPENFRFSVLRDESGPVLEREVRVEIAPGVPLVAVIDRIDEISDDTIELVDYKTSRVPLDEDRLADNLQLAVYAMLARKLFPEYQEVITTLNYLRHGRVSILTDPTQDEDVIAYLVGLYETITSDSDHEARINAYCGWCHARMKCEAYLSLGTEEISNRPSPENFERLWLELDRVSARLRIFEKRKRELQDSLKAIFEKTDCDSMIVGDREIYVAQTPRGYAQVRSRRARKGGSKGWT